ncbi:MAG: response regulator [Desulfobacteraceae bacterium]|nr:MAG: response regulator [Desulfobacteraceae bacterium]
MNNPPKILIVDDSSIIRRALKKELERFGAVVAQAVDGLQGQEMALASGFDLIISDVEMPKLDGFDLCQRLKCNPATRGIPVIILSSMDHDRDVEKGFKSGADAYISKSEAHNHLIDTVERVLEKSRFHRSRLILVVDDSPSIRRLVGQGLEGAGFQVVAAGNGKQAIKRIEGRRPDLILSDIDMPEMNGLELCRKIHSDPSLSGIPFVIMSANNDRAVMRSTVQSGAAGYLVKPFNLEQVVITVERLLSDHFLILLKERERLDSEQKMMLASITSLITALEARDPYTRGHSEAVAAIVRRMGVRMNVGPEEVESLGIAGRLHDLGKIGVPDSILLKPGRLSEAEFAVIRQHPVTGASILGSIPSIKPILPVILHHHERYDGKGYPDKIKGKQIMLWARMTAVADTFHALTSDRPYRRGMNREEAMIILEEVRGTQLCPECVDVFRNVLQDLPGEYAVIEPRIKNRTENQTLLAAQAALPLQNSSLRMQSLRKEKASEDRSYRTGRNTSSASRVRPEPVRSAGQFPE